MAYQQAREHSLLLWLVLEAMDIWRSYASPLQHPWFRRPKLPSHRARRDVPYLASFLTSMAIFVTLQYYDSLVFYIGMTALCLFRATDILVSLTRIAVVGSYGQTPAYRLNRLRVMRNIVAIFMNYIELIFWYSSVYLCLSACKPAEFNEPLTPPLALVLSFSTISTVGYGNVAPQGMLAALLSAAQAITAVVALSSVVGSLINLSASPNRGANQATEGKGTDTFPDSMRLSGRSVVWLIQRVIVFAGFLTLSFRALTDGTLESLIRIGANAQWLRHIGL